MAVWEDYGNDGNNNNFISLAVIAPGTPSDPDAGEFKVEDTTGLITVYGPSIATFANGTYIVGYTRSEQNVPNADVRVAIIRADGTGYTPGLGVPQTVSAPNDLFWHDSGSSAVATFGNTAVLVYRDQLVIPRPRRRWGRPIFVWLSSTPPEWSWIPRSSRMSQIFSAPPMSSRSRTAASSSSGSTPPTTISSAASTIRRPTSFSGAAFVVSNGASYQETPNVAALPDGGFIVTWTNSSKTLGDTSEAIHGRRFDASGAFAGDEFLVNTATTGNQNSSALAVNAAGTIFVGWTDSAATNPFSTDTVPVRIEGQFFKPLTEVVNGTAADDTICHL